MLYRGTVKKPGEGGAAVLFDIAKIRKGVLELLQHLMLCAHQLCRGRSTVLCSV